MQDKYFRRFTSVLALGLIVLFGANFEAFGQKGHGKGKDKHGGENRSERRGGDDDRKGSGKHRGDRQEPRYERRGDDDQRRSDRNARHQQNQSDRESRRQQSQSDWNSRRQQEQSDTESHRQQVRGDRESRRQQNQSDNKRRRHNDDDDNRRIRQNRNYERRIYSNQDRRPINLGNFGNIWNYGQKRSAQVHERNDRRKQFKDQQKAWRRAEKAERKVNRRYTGQIWDDRRYNSRDNNSYEDGYYNYNDDNDGSGWKDQILRSVLSNVIGNRLGGGQNYASQQYEPYYNRAPYLQQAYYNNTPQQYGYNYGSPYNEAYQPAGYYDDAQSYGGGSNLGGLLGALPISELIGQFAGDGVVGELLTGFLAQGYDQGFLAGRSARENGYGDQYYQDPYVTEQGIYDPYSVSMGENRQILSEGYGLGYEDALNGQTDYDPQSEGNTDLVSLLLGSVLGNI